MPPPLPDEVRNAIISDLKEGRLSYSEIALMRLGNANKKGTIANIAKKNDLRPPPRKKRSQKEFITSKPATVGKVNLKTYNPEARLRLIDKALSYLEDVLGKSRYPKGMMEWTSALERLLDQRRIEEPPTGDKAGAAAIIEFNELLRNEACSTEPEAEAEHN